MRYVLAAIGLIVIFVVWMAPASLIRMALEPVPGADVIAPQGTLWNGSGELLVDGQRFGQLTWKLRPVTVLQLTPGYDLTLRDEAMNLSGFAAASTEALRIEGLRGMLPAELFAPWLARYDMEIGGALAIEGLDGRWLLGEQRLEQATGQLFWDGGRVRYRLSGQQYVNELPALQAEIETDDAGPNAQVRASEDPTLLIQARLKADGFAQVGITKRLTQLLQTPWPGSDPDHSVVLEIEEQLF